MNGFADILVARITPHLIPLEEARRQQRLILRRRAAGFAVLCLGWLGTVLVFGHPLLWLAAPVLAAIGLFITLQLRAAPGRDYAEALRAVALPPVCEFCGGWKYERVNGRDVFSRAGERVEPDWPLFVLPDWHSPIAASVMLDIERLIGLLNNR